MDNESDVVFGIQYEGVARVFNLEDTSEGMAGGSVRQGFKDAEFCRSHPDTYQLCASDICVHIDTSCPCQHGAEYRCPGGLCVPNSALCDGVRNCPGGADEIACPGRAVTSPDDGVPLHVIIALTCVCVAVCMVALIVVGYFVLRRRKNNISRESQSVTQPLKTKYPPPVVTDSSEKYDDPVKSSKRDYVYHQMYETSGEFEYDKQLCKRKQEEKETAPPEEEKPTNTHKNNTFKPNICTLRNMKVYDFEHDANESFGNGEMGKYIFKPRLKGARERTDATESQTNGVHEIVHSYKHAHKGQTSLPTTFNFDLDPDNFGSSFATELLCSSTPRQTMRRLVVHQSHDSLADDVIVITNMAGKSEPKHSLCLSDSQKVNKSTCNTDGNVLSISTNIDYIDVSPNVSQIKEDFNNEVF